MNALSFSPDGKLLASGGIKYFVLFTIIAIFISKSFTSGEDKTIKLWDISSGKLIKSLKGHSSIVLSLDFSSDGNQIASTALDNTVKLWDVKSADVVEIKSEKQFFAK